MTPYEPQVTVSESRAGVRLTLAGLAHGDGATLQDAADALVQRLLGVAIAVRSSGVCGAHALTPADVAALAFLHELADFAARGGDIRERLF